MILWQRDDVSICDKLRAQYIPLGKVYKTWKVSDLWWGKETNTKIRTTLITWSQEVTCQIENLISPFLQVYTIRLYLYYIPITPKFAGRWLMVTGIHPWSHMTLWLCNLARSHEKFNTQYLFRNVLGTQVWLEKGLHPEMQMTIDHLRFVMLNLYKFVTLNLYKIDTTIDKHDFNFIIWTNGLENTFNTK